MINNITKPLFISFSAEVNQDTAENLMGVFAQRLNQGTKDFYLLLSSPGGNVINGVTIYNFLKSLPINLTTHNIGIVDSIANVVFLAGKTRYAVKNSSFLFHGVGFDVNQARFEEKNIKAQKTKQKEVTSAEDLKGKLDGKSIQINLKTGGGDKLFGAVTSKEVAELIEKHLKIKIDRKKIEITEPIKHLGDYVIKIKLYPSIQAEIKLTVSAE